MPLIVDHDARRHEVATVAARLLANAGPKLVTVRDIADATGYSTTVVSHYFRSKGQLLLFIHKELASRLLDRLTAGMGTGSLQEFLELILPLYEESQTEWRVWLAFWNRLKSEPEFERYERPYTKSARDVIEVALRKWRDAGYLKAGIDCHVQADRLITLIVGLGTQWAFEPQLWPPERLRRFIALELDQLKKRKR